MPIPEQYSKKFSSLVSKMRCPERLAAIFFGILCLIYIYLFYKSISAYWFKPNWTTDDALQQLFPFHKVFEPEIFKDDLIAQMMEHYLAPVHYWLTYALTWITGDLVMASHWMMLIQLVLSAGFLFATIRCLAGVAPAFFGVAWFFHSRDTIQRITGGLPRGWAAPVLIAGLYCMAAKRHRLMLVTLFIGCLTHPPATLLLALTYGLYLLALNFDSKSRAENFKFLKRYILLSPLYIGLVFYVTTIPTNFGKLATLPSALEMPQFLAPGGRFAFLPFRPIIQDLKIYGFQAFISRFFSPEIFDRWDYLGIALGLLVVLTLVVLIRRKQEILPSFLFFYLISIASVYLLSRELAFRLYVPNRHLQLPLTFFFIVTFSVGFWRVFVTKPVSNKVRQVFAGSIGLCILGLIVYLGSGSGLQSSANFNYPVNKRGNVFAWIRDNTPKDSLIAGHPTFIDPVQLFSIRKGFATSETYHPFYDLYMKEMERRLEISLKAHYATSFEEIVALLSPEGVDYFIFQRAKFYPDELAKNTYYPPLDNLARSLGLHENSEYAYRKLPVQLDLEKFPYLVYRDHLAVVIDIGKLKKFIESN